MSNRRGGTIQLQIDGVLYEAKGAFDYNLGIEKREAIIGAGSVHGFKETPQAAFIEGKITDRVTLDVKAMLRMTDATATLTLANGKTVVLPNAWYAGEGNVNTEEGEIDVRFESAKEAQEIT
jgi:tail tube protein